MCICVNFDSIQYNRNNTIIIVVVIVEQSNVVLLVSYPKPAALVCGGEMGGGWDMLELESQGVRLVGGVVVVGRCRLLCPFALSERTNTKQRSGIVWRAL